MWKYISSKNSLINLRESCAESFKLKIFGCCVTFRGMEDHSFPVMLFFNHRNLFQHIRHLIRSQPRAWARLCAPFSFVSPDCKLIEFEFAPLHGLHLRSFFISVLLFRIYWYLHCIPTTNVRWRFLISHRELVQQDLSYGRRIHDIGHLDCKPARVRSGVDIRAIRAIENVRRVQLGRLLHRSWPVCWYLQRRRRIGLAGWFPL